MKKLLQLVVISYFIFLITSCTPKLDIPEPGAGDANFSKTIAIGGNFMAGYKERGLYQKKTKNFITPIIF